MLVMAALVARTLSEKSCGGKEWWPDEGGESNGSLLFFIKVE